VDRGIFHLAVFVIFLLLVDLLVDVSYLGMERIVIRKYVHLTPLRYWSVMDLHMEYVIELMLLVSVYILGVGLCVVLLMVIVHLLV